VLLINILKGPVLTASQYVVSSSNLGDLSLFIGKNTSQLNTSLTSAIQQTGYQSFRHHARKSFSPTSPADSVS